MATLNSSNTYMKPETLPTLESVYVSKALNFCEYGPSYLLDPAKKENFGRISQRLQTCALNLHLSKHTVEGLTPMRAARFLAEEPLSDGEARVVALEESCPG